MFEYHENLTLEEAVIAYQGIPAWRRNAGQGLELWSIWKMSCILRMAIMI